MSTLAKIRHDISEIDRALLEVLKKRMGLVKTAGQLKKSAGLPMKAPEVEATIIEHYRNFANAEKYPPEILENIAKLIVELAHHVQDSAGS